MSRKSAFLVTLAAGTLLAASASAQPARVRDHRTDRVGSERVPARRAGWQGRRTVVSSLSPTAGTAGTSIVIRGKNFIEGTVVLYGNRSITPSMISPSKIVFDVPRGRQVKSATIALDVPGMRRSVAVGSFEVTRRDAAADARRTQRERRLRAERRWNRQRSTLGDRSARLRDMRKRERELEDTRGKRRAARVKDMRSHWKRAFLADPDTVAELKLHSERVARLERMRRLAVVDDRSNLVIRIDVLIDRETSRHERRMTILEKNYIL